MIYLYELRWEVEGDTLRYIGTSKDPELRYRTHRSHARAGIHRSSRVTETWRRYGDAELVKLVCIEDAERRRVEDAWLARYHDDPGLLNASKRAIAAQDPEVQKRAQAGRGETAKGRVGVELTLPGEGPRKFDALIRAAAFLNVAMSTLANWLQGSHPWPGHKRTPRKFRHLSGLTGRYLTPEEAHALSPGH